MISLSRHGCGPWTCRAPGSRILQTASTLPLRWEPRMALDPQWNLSCTALAQRDLASKCALQPRCSLAARGSLQGLLQQR